MSESYEEKCGYFEDRKSKIKMHLMPDGELSIKILKDYGIDDIRSDYAQMLLYNSYLLQGYRRSGNLIYLNECEHCKECIPIRIDTSKYVFSKNERYLMRKNSDIKCVFTHKAQYFYTNDKVDLLYLYSKRHDENKNWSETRCDLAYLNGCYDQWKMDYTLHSSYAGVRNMDYYIDGKLAGCSVLDFTGEALSSNYFYYDTDPAIMKRSLGTYSILNEIEFCKKHNIKYYYLGYWIKDCRKMSYKARFKPHELLIDNDWTEIQK